MAFFLHGTENRGFGEGGVILGIFFAFSFPFSPSLSLSVFSNRTLLLRGLETTGVIILIGLADQALEFKLLGVPDLLAIRGTVSGQAGGAICGRGEGDVAVSCSC